VLLLKISYITNISGSKKDNSILCLEVQYSNSYSSTFSHKQKQSEFNTWLYIFFHNKNNLN